MKIVLDAFGGDNAPGEILKGAVEALNINQKLELLIVGKEDIIKEELNKIGYSGSRVEILNAPDVITNEDAPAISIRKKTDSSLVVGFNALKERDDLGAIVSAGSTGALLSGALLKLGRSKGVLRPTLLSVLPTVTKRRVILADSGANVDCKSEYLTQFAIMANIYAKYFLKIENPSVALLSVGTEDEKGNEVSKAAFEQIKKLSLNFVGNMEARDFLSGNYDVVVADGFSGNVMMKATEGAALNFLKIIKEAIYSTFVSKIGGLLIKKQMHKVKDIMDYSNYGGALFLGCKKLVCKCHGSSKSKSIRTTLLETFGVLEAGVVEKINAEIENQSEGILNEG